MSSIFHKKFGAWGKMIHEKTPSKKSHDTVLKYPLEELNQGTRMSMKTSILLSLAFFTSYCHKQNKQSFRFCFAESQVVTSKNGKFFVDDVTGCKIRSVKQSVILRMPLPLKCSSAHTSRQLFFISMQFIIPS
jgi:hypothetical protein